MPAGRPRKHHRNITGLQNQASADPAITADTVEAVKESSLPGAFSDSDIGNELSGRTIPEVHEANVMALDEEGVSSEEERNPPEGPPESDIDTTEEELEFWRSEDAAWKLIGFAKQQGDDPKDQDWFPYTVKNSQTLKRARPSSYIKGPDVMSKRPRTVRRYRKLMKNQKRLDIFGFKKEARAPVVVDSSESDNNHDGDSDSGGDILNVLPLHRELRCEGDAPEDQPEVVIRQESVEVEIPSPEQSEFEEEFSPSPQDEIDEAFEEEMDEVVHPASKDVKGWAELREQVKEDLEKGSKTLPMSKINKLMVLRNFMTLMLKGYGRIVASKEIAQQWKDSQGTHFAREIRALVRHYEVWEQLPEEKRGGTRQARTLLSDERVQHALHTWLNLQAAGTVTPRLFLKAVNENILPSLNIHPKFPLCERTARRWLSKLGWKLTLHRKGVGNGGVRGLYDQI